MTTAQQFAGATGVAVIGTMFSAIATSSGSYPAAMAWAATADFALVLTVSWMTWKFKHLADDENDDENLVGGLRGRLRRG